MPANSGISTFHRHWPRRWSLQKARSSSGSSKIKIRSCFGERLARHSSSLKKNGSSLAAAFQQFVGRMYECFAQHRTWQRAKRLSLSQLACLGRHTVTGLLCAGGRQFADWSADYRLFSQDQWDGQQLFAPVRRGVLELSDTVCVKAVSCCIENQPI